MTHDDATEIFVESEQTPGSSQSLSPVPPAILEPDVAAHARTPRAGAHGRAIAVMHHLDWRRVAELAVLSRTLDDYEERIFAKSGDLPYQFSCRGHELVQTVVGIQLGRNGDAVSLYYRSRAFLLALGVGLDDLMSSALARSGGFSDGRDIGVVPNRPDGVVILPMAGDVGSQFTPALGWAQSLALRRDLGETIDDDAIAVAVGGDASVATGGFWSAVNIAATESLPVLFLIEDNGLGVSVASNVQTPGGDIALNLSGLCGLQTQSCSGSDPTALATAVERAVSHVRRRREPYLLRAVVPRLCGHSGEDRQHYKSPVARATDYARDPLPHLKHLLVPDTLSVDEWSDLRDRAKDAIELAVQSARSRPQPDPTALVRFRFSEPRAHQARGGMRNTAQIRGQRRSVVGTGRLNMAEAIRHTMLQALETNPRTLLFGQDVAAMGGVHGVSAGLQSRIGSHRVFDTSLSEEGIVGRAIGLAIAGLVPIAEIQFRKYMDAASEQLANCSSIRWRTANRFAAPVILRTPVGMAKVGDPWHSVCDEASLIRRSGWRVAFPSNATDAVGLLRTALLGDDPTFFLEHRHLLDDARARAYWPGDDYQIQFGVARIVRTGSAVTVVSWGAMVHRSLAAIEQTGIDAELIDLRTLQPWDRDAVVGSVRKTQRCLIVHEDHVTGGFGAEISATLARDAITYLDAPIERLGASDVPIPYSPRLLDASIPTVDRIARVLVELCDY